MKRRMGDGTTFCVCLVMAAWLAPAAQAQVQNQVFTTIAPCRLIDTRNATAGKMSANEARTFNVYGDLQTQGGPAGGCGLPEFTADGAPRVQALAINYVAVNAEAQGNLKAWASDQGEPTSSIINFAALNPPTNLANGTITAVRQNAAGGSDLTIRASQKVHVVADVVGYFQRQAVRTEITGDEDTAFITQTPNVIGGSADNVAGAGLIGATIAGGGQRRGPGLEFLRNQVDADFGTVGGGKGNDAGAQGSTVAGGVSNAAGATHATVGGGNLNIAGGMAATVPGGRSNLANGAFSFAAGRQAVASADGSFVWADSQPFPFSTNTQNLFRVRATGGIGLVTAVDGSGNVTKNCFISTSAGINCDGMISGGSDRASKENLSPVDDREVLRKVAALPISRWNYRAKALPCATSARWRRTSSTPSPWAPTTSTSRCSTPTAWHSRQSKRCMRWCATGTAASPRSGGKRPCGSLRWRRGIETKCGPSPHASRSREPSRRRPERRWPRRSSCTDRPAHTPTLLRVPGCAAEACRNKRNVRTSARR